MAFISETFISQSSKKFQKLRSNGMFILLALLLVSSSSPSSLLSLITLLLYPFLLGATQHILMNGGKYTDPLIHVFHAFFGIGLFLGAQIAGPFLQVKYINRTSELQQIARNTSTPLGMLSMHVHNDSIGEDVSANITLVKVYDAPIEIPALIGGVVALGVPIFFSIFQIAQWMSKDSGESGQTVEKATVPKKTSIQDAMDPTTCTGRGRCFGLTMLVLLFIMYFNHTGGEHLLWKFIFSFAMESKNLGFSVDEAIWMSSAFAIAFTCGRLTTGLCAKFMIPEIMWAILLCLNVLAGIILSIWGNDLKMVAWVCIISYGAVVGPLFPTGQAWANRYLHLSTLATALFYISANLGYLTYSRVTGYLFDVYGVATMPWMCLTFAGLCLVNLLIMQIIATRHGLKKPKTTAEKSTPHEERLMETTT